MDTNTYNCINIDTYTHIYPILVAGRFLALTHLAAKDSFEDAHLVVTLCVIVRANAGTCTQVPAIARTMTQRVSVALFYETDIGESLCTVPGLHRERAKGNAPTIRDRRRANFTLSPLR